MIIISICYVAKIKLNQCQAEGLVEGKAEGLVEGKAEGLAEGEAKGKIELLKRLLTRRFGEVPDWAMATIEVTNIEQLELWAEAIFDAKDIEELLK